ncbi:DUF6894 family protein [Aureimonas ureilytica]|uniref:DUF6894 family protein n=1 Tax=Aureimonas ureilytica TaxID=401562 RepID=UPI00037B8C6B|nr:hypothetical protein [Aureimonas ureilytica]
MRYYLHIRNGDVLIEDFEGEEFPDLDAARREAVRCVRELLAERLRRGDVLDGEAIEIWDETGRFVDSVSFRSQLRLPGSAKDGL